MERKIMELYLHIPFCIQKCKYCDFLSFPMDDEGMRAYVDALLREIAAQAVWGRGKSVSTLFIGGGTPSIVPAGEIARILEAVCLAFSVLPEAEISMEMNPGTITREKLAEYRTAGINRVSLGAQSLHDEELRFLGRIHTAEEFYVSYELVRSAGFQNVNIDLMSAIPGQSLVGWEDNLHRVTALSPEHISAYSLIVEEGTPFAAMKLELPDEEEERQMVYRTNEILEAAGYAHYEISNYAREGFACRHNIGYWRREEYLGLGLGAASLMGETRWKNTGDLQRYLQAWNRADSAAGALRGEAQALSRTDSAAGALREEVQTLAVSAQMEEFMFLGLRMLTGVEEDVFFQKFGVPMEKIYGDTLKKLAAWGMLERNAGNVRLTQRGVDVSNAVLAEFLI